MYNFVLKVTHIVFRNGNRKTYNKAIELNIPLVSARWVENCRIANKVLNPIDYPPIDIDKFKKPVKLTYNISVSELNILFYEFNFLNGY